MLFVKSRKIKFWKTGWLIVSVKQDTYFWVPYKKADFIFFCFQYALF